MSKFLVLVVLVVLAIGILPADVVDAALSFGDGKYVIIMGAVVVIAALFGLGGKHK